MLKVIAFDADDTLWHNETNYRGTEKRVTQMLSAYRPPETVAEVIYATEMRNLALFGYGAKSFALSLIEAAIEVSAGTVTAAEIQAIIDLARAMLERPVEVFEGVTETLQALDGRYELMLITKGDLLDQESKVTRSGLRGAFATIEVVSDKTPESYRRLLAHHGIAPESFLMVGNSLRSDILPVTAIGGQAVYIPHALTWAHENNVDGHEGPHDYHELQSIRELPALLARIDG